MSVPKPNIMGATCTHCGYINYFNQPQKEQLCRESRPVWRDQNGKQVKTNELKTKCSNCGKEFKFDGEC